MEENKNITDNNIAEDLANDMPPELKVAGNQRRDSEARWYVLHTFNGYETVAEDNLKKVIEKYEVYGIFKDLSEMADRLSIPEEDRIYYKDGTLVGIRIDNRGIIKRLGIPGKDVFLTLRIPMESTDEEMMDQAPNVAEYMLK